MLGSLDTVILSAVDIRWEGNLLSVREARVRSSGYQCQDPHAKLFLQSIPVLTIRQSVLQELEVFLVLRSVLHYLLPVFRISFTRQMFQGQFSCSFSSHHLVSSGLLPKSTSWGQRPRVRRRSNDLIVQLISTFDQLHQVIATKYR
jgi:hypothetical protein